MKLERLHLSNFRNFVASESAEASGGGEVHAPRPIEVPFGPRFTVLSGHNGAGKTNVLEALYFVSTLRSFRGADLGTMVRRGCTSARVELVGLDLDLGLRSRLEVRIDRGPRSTRRSARVDGKLVRAAADFYGRAQAILFTPEDLNVLRGSPSSRRQFLDRVVFARARAHIADVQSYEKLVRSRNRVLKADPADLRGVERERLLDTYDEGLSEAGARIWTRRAAVIDEVRAPFRAAFGQIFDGPDASLACDLRYASRLSDPVEVDDSGSSAASPSAQAAIVDSTARQQALLEDLRARRATDLQRGTTNTGPHRDDLAVTLDGEPAAHFASQGQARALVLAFKIAELRDVRDRLGRQPLLLLDDVSSELDPDRNARLFSALSAEAGQCVITTTAARHIALDEAVPRLDLEVDSGRVTVAESRD